MQSSSEVECTSAHFDFDPPSRETSSPDRASIGAVVSEANPKTPGSMNAGLQFLSVTQLLLNPRRTKGSETGNP